MRPRTAAALLAMLIVPLASAHEFWISPDHYSIRSNELVRINLRHGERFAGDVVPRDEAAVERFEFVSAAGATPARGLNGHEFSFLRPDQPGPGVIVYQTHEYLSVLPAERFEAYLIEEGLDEIATRRREMGETGAVGREAYLRCAKALIQVGEAMGDSPESATPARPDQVERVTPVDSVVGLPCEIVLESCEPAPEGTAMSVLVLFEGAPLSDARLVAVAQSQHEALIELRTDADGRAWLTTDVPGAWMFTTLHMTRAEGRDDVDWVSYWASLTFEIGG